MKAFMKGFVYALRGIGIAVGGRNMRFHIVAAIVVVVAGVHYGITTTQWLLVALCIGAVISAEIFNTSVEAACNLIGDVANLGIDSRIRDIKDLAAGAVLVISIVSAIVGAVIFIPHIF